jgi:hypothetical protein
MTDSKRLELLGQKGIKGIEISKLPAENEIVASLSSIANGLSDLSEIN